MRWGVPWLGCFLGTCVLTMYELSTYYVLGSC